MKACLLSLTALVMVIMVRAQTADEIIAKHIEAVGGKETITKITSVIIESGTEVMGNQSSAKTYIVNGKAYRNELDFNGQSLVQVVTDKGGWAINPFTGGSDPAAMAPEEFNSNADLIYAGDPLVNYAANGGNVELAGQEKIGDINAYKIKYTNKYNVEILYYIDPATSYIIQASKKANVMGQEVTVNTTLSNYQKTDFGIMMPYTINIDMGQFAMQINTKKVEINKAIDEKIFEMVR
ncbi:hypothetical protein BH10BAC2_BH10BAC2_06050 [soil metagenome]